MKNIPNNMLKWGKSAITGSSWKRKHSFPYSELDYNFDYQKMDNSFEYEMDNINRVEDDSIFISDNYYKYNDNNGKDKENWNSISFNDSFTSSTSNCSNKASIHSEPIKEKDALEWKKYVQYEIKDNDYLNLNINNLLKEYIDKNKNVNNSSNNHYKPKANNTETYYDKYIDIKPMKPSAFNNNYTQNDYDNQFLNNSRKSTKKSASVNDYDIQTIEYNLKYNSNYDVENIPEEIIMELLNNQLYSKDIDETLVSNSNNKSLQSSPIPMRTSSLKNYKLDDFDTMSKEDSSTLISDLTSNSSQAHSITDNNSENNWNPLDMMNEFQDLSLDDSNDNHRGYHPFRNRFNSLDNSELEECRQFYLENCPPTIQKKGKEGYKESD